MTIALLAGFGLGFEYPPRESKHRPGLILHD